MKLLGQTCSFELSPADVLRSADHFSAFQERVNPEDSTVFVNWVQPTPEHGTRVAQATRKLINHGFEAIPIVPTCRFAEPSEMAKMLTKYQPAAIMLCGGNDCIKVGRKIERSQRSALDFVESGGASMLRSLGVSTVTVTGYPEGHPHLNIADSDSILGAKLRVLLAEGLNVQVVSQFTLHPVMLSRWLQRVCGILREVDLNLLRVTSQDDGFDLLRSGRVKLHVGVAGPTRHGRLNRAARMCKVALGREDHADIVQAEFLTSSGGDNHVWPFTDAQFVASACERLRLPENAVHLNVFPFGGLIKALDFAEALRADEVRDD
jgi:methylenetetrahydrofolate reductase (NADPH)